MPLLAHLNRLCWATWRLDTQPLTCPLLRLRLQLRGAILRALELFPASRALPHDERYALAAAAGGRHGGAGAPSGAPVPPEVAATAQALVEHVLGCCLQVGGVGGRWEQRTALERLWVQDGRCTVWVVSACGQPSDVRQRSCWRAWKR